MKRKKKNVTLISMITANIVAIFLFVFVFATYTNSESEGISEEKNYDFYNNFRSFGIICKRLEQNCSLSTNFATCEYIPRDGNCKVEQKDDICIGKVASGTDYLKDNSNCTINEKFSEEIKDALKKFDNYSRAFDCNEGTIISDIDKEINIKWSYFEV